MVMRDQGIYGLASNTSSSFSLASSQFSIDKVNHAFGSLPPPCPVPSLSASSSSLPLVTSINNPTTTPAIARTKTTPASPSLTTKHRSSSFIQGHGHRTVPHTLSGSDLPPSTNSPTQASPSLRTQLLPPVAILTKLPNRRRTSDTVLHLNTESLFSPVSITPPTVSSSDSLQTDCSPPPSSKQTPSDASGIPGSAPSTPIYSKPLAAMAKADLVVSEANHVAAMKRVESALNLALETSAAAGRKEKDTRLLVDRWSEMTRAYTKFHDDTDAMNEDLPEVVGLLNGLLATLGPMLVSHSRDLAVSLKKLSRRDQNPEHMVTKWNSALRRPFEHLADYGEWLQQVDPQSIFSKDCRGQLDLLIYKIHNVTVVDNNQSRNMLRRLSTIARMVTKRRSTSSNPQTPTVDTIEKAEHTFASSSPLVPQNKYETVQDLAIARNDGEIHTKTGPSSPLDLGQEKELPELPITSVTELETRESTPTISGDIIVPVNASKPQQHRTSTASELSTSDTLVVMEPSFGSISSSSSVHSKTSAETLPGRPINSLNSSIGQKVMAERESRKATLRLGASETIQARASRLQSSTFMKKPPIEGLRKVSSKVNEKNNKPPVSSLIGFWEQVTGP
ncbi:MAG: hypothetical protein J3Q66DRAFT_346033 [Benniella sp.]|nr:MAG: hypothetical protein J3Q66DRAFT_346033 [Benniella sp.]